MAIRAAWARIHAFEREGGSGSTSASARASCRRFGPVPCEPGQVAEEELGLRRELGPPGRDKGCCCLPQLLLSFASLQGKCASEAEQDEARSASSTRQSSSARR